MGTIRDFHVKTGLVVDSGNVTLTNGNLLVNSGHVDIDNIKIDGQTISTVTGDEAINITPHGTGSVVISKVDINAGTIDGATIATSDITVGSGKTLDVSAGTLTLADDQISGDKVSGGTIGTVTITELGGHLSLGDNNITNVGDLNADSISVDDAAVGLDIQFGGNTTLNKISLTDNLPDALNITEGSNSYIKFTTTTSSEQIVFGKNSTFAGTTIADLGTVTTADINGGTFDGITSLTAGNNLDIGAYDFRAATLTADGLTSGRVVFAGTNGVLSDDSDLTFSGDTLTATKYSATTSYTVGSTVITDDSIVMTPSTDDTITIAGATNGALGITTVDNAANAAHITATADGDITLNTKNIGNSGNDAKIAFQYNDADRVRVRSGTTAGAPYLEVLGNVDITGSIQGGTTASPSAGVTNIRGSGFIHSGSARMRQSDGVMDTADIAAGQAGTHNIIDIDDTNFYTSDVVSVTEVSGNFKTPGTSFDTNANNTGNVILIGLNVENTSRNVFQAVEAFCVLGIKNASNIIQKRVVNKIIGFVAPGGVIQSHIIHESGDTDLGYFHFVYAEDAGGAGADGMVLVFKYTSRYQHTSNDETSYSFNMNGHSLSGAGG
jgi:hypothetical protein